MRELRQVGRKATMEQAIDDQERPDDHESLFRLSDEVIDLMKDSWRDDESLKKLSSPIKDSSDKPGLIIGIKSCDWLLALVGQVEIRMRVNDQTNSVFPLIVLTIDVSEDLNCELPECLHLIKRPQLTTCHSQSRSSTVVTFSGPS
jgi:hypothetical protein